MTRWLLEGVVSTVVAASIWNWAAIPYLQRLRVLKATVRPKCPGCGMLDQSQWPLSRYLGSFGKRHAALWRPDVLRISFTCWYCSAEWGEIGLNERITGEPSSNWCVAQAAKAASSGNPKQP